ncbi:hypothetical protein uan_053 [Pseudomonas phage UAntarctica]|nr:hypothetical protein uan_053 [Pseudomonas phage UAntarctica]
MDFKFNVLTGNPERLNVVGSKLGSAAGQKYTTTDIAKAMVMGPVGNHYLAPADAEIEGFLDNVDGGPPAGGFPFGGVSRPNAGLRVLAQVGPGQATALVFKDLVVADAQLPLGTKGLPRVKKGTPGTYKWQVITLNGDGTAGTTVVLERI